MTALHEGLRLRLEPPGFDLHARVACRRLAPDPTAAMPWVSYGFDRSAIGLPVDEAPGTGPTLTFEWLPADDTPWWELEAQALATLRTNTLRMQLREVPLDGRPSRIATVGTDARLPDPWAAERICDPDAMRRLAEELQAGPDLLVAVPTRGFLAAMSAGGEPDAVRRFTMAAAARFRAGPNAITPVVFVVSRGLVAGRVDVTTIVGEA